jgi:hypothetical protein
MKLPSTGRPVPVAGQAEDAEAEEGGAGREPDALEKTVALLMSAKVRRAGEARNVDQLKVCLCYVLLVLNSRRVLLLCLALSLSLALPLPLFACVVPLQIFDPAAVGVVGQQVHSKDPISDAQLLLRDLRFQERAEARERAKGAFDYTLDGTRVRRSVCACFDPVR